MENLEIKLIEGNFTPKEARKVLSTVINGKINYHKIELLSEHERNGFENLNSRKRVEYLTKANDDVIEIIHKAIGEGQNFEISANIVITLK
jgi:hypothetical protein